MRPAQVRWSGSIRQTTWTPFMPARAPTWAPPRPLRPATARRTVSLEPSTLPDDLVPAMVTVAAAARVPTKSRRLRRGIATPVEGEGGLGVPPVVGAATRPGKYDPGRLLTRPAPAARRGGCG